jgi:hypothetical protein
MSGVITASVVVAGATIYGASKAAGAASSAANAQQDAANRSAELAYKTSQEQIAAQKEALDKQIAASGATVDKQLLAQRDALDQQMAFQQARYEQARLDFAPYRDTGVAATNQLNTLLGIGGNAGAADYGKYKTAEFTPADFAAGVDPGYAFRLSEGLKGLDRQAAARGGLISGNALKAASGYAGDQASQEYQAAYNRYQTTRGNTLSPFQNLSAQGLNAAAMTGTAGAAYGNAGGQAISNAGQGASTAFGNAGNAANTAYGNYGQGVTGALGAYGTNATNALTGGANAAASGYVGSANAVNAGIGGLANQYYQNQMLNMFRSNPTTQYGATNTYNNMMSNGGFGSGNAFGNQDLGANF